MMKLNPFKKLLSAVSPAVKQDSSAFAKYDESVLQQGRFWMRTVTWTLIGTTVFGVGWLALARTEEIVVAAGKLEPIGSVKDIQMPVGGVADSILVKEGQRVSAGDVLMRLDTEASEEQRKSLEKTMALKEEQLTLKDQGCIGGYHPPRPCRTVAEFRGDDQLAFPSDLHGHNPLVPPTNHIAFADCERNGLVPRPGGIKGCTVVQETEIVHCHRVALLR